MLLTLVAICCFLKMKTNRQFEKKHKIIKGYIQKKDFDDGLAARSFCRNLAYNNQKNKAKSSTNTKTCTDKLLRKNIKAFINTTFFTF